MKIDKISQLTREIKTAIEDHEDTKFPVEFEYTKGLEHPTFLIIIDCMEKESYVDANGYTWIKQK